MSNITNYIPHRPPFLFVDEIVSESDTGLIAQRTWRADEDFYRGHYPGMPITPGVLLCESVFQTGALFLARKQAAKGLSTQEGVPLLARITDVRFRNPVFPGDTIVIEVEEKETLGGFIFMKGSVRCGEKRVLNVEFSVMWKKADTAQSEAPRNKAP
jgi:3-hydroxyacyl-[acyl-carrier-protein] dehydratase